VDEPIKLTRWYPGGDRGPNGYLICESAIGVASCADGWELRAVRNNSYGREWLHAHQLDAAAFPSRRAALRAYEAARSLSAPPPAAGRPRLRRVRAGHYQQGEAAITRPRRETSWTVNIPGISPRRAATLNDAVEIITTISVAQQLSRRLEQIADRYAGAPS